MKKINIISGLTFLIIFFNSCLKEEIPTLSTPTINGITGNSASVTVTVTGEGSSFITGSGFCWSTKENPTINDNNSLDNTGVGSFSRILTELQANTTYFVRAYATNSVGTAYSSQVSFTTLTFSSVATISISSITHTTASSGGDISNDGGNPITERGVCWGTSPNPTKDNTKTADGTGIGIFTSLISGLSHSTTYYVRAYASNSAGTAYGNEISFKTTVPVTSISLNDLIVRLEILETYQLSENIKPETATNKKTIWKSSNNQVATVSEKGLVAALSIGEAIITVTSEDGKYSATCSIEVTNKLKILVTDLINIPISQATVLALDPITKTYIYGQTGTDGRLTLYSPIKKTVTVLVAHPQQKGEIILGQLNSESLTVKMIDNSYGSVLAPERTCYIPGLSGRLNPILDNINRLYLYADNISINNGTLQPVTFDHLNSLKLEDAYGKVKTIWIPFMDGKTALINYQPK